MTDVLRIKRRVSGAPGAPAGLANAELAYSEVDHILYYGEGTGGSGGSASVITAVGGQGLFSSANPTMNSGATGGSGSATTWSRSDHLHPSDTSRAPIAAPSFTGIVTITGSITGTGMTAWSSSPGPIGNTTPSSGAFTSLSVSGAISGAGLSTWLASPPAIGGTAPAAGSFTNLSASGIVSGAGFTNYFASPPAIGVTAPSTGAFTTLSASGVISGGGFTNYFASPPAIGGTTAAAGSFTNLSATGTVSGAGFTGLLSTYAKINAQTFTGAMVLSPTTTGTTPAVNTNDTSIATTQFVRQVRLDQFALPTATVNMNGQIVSNVQQGTAGTDVATRAYVDSNVTGLVAHASVVAGTTSNITLTGVPQTIDGYPVQNGDRVLVKDQTVPQNNGIYIAGATWSRALDMDVWTEVPQAYVLVTNGTVNSASGWVCNSPPGGTIGTTAITWQQFSQQTQVTAGGGLTRTGNSFDVIGTAGRILVNADSIDIDSTYVGQASITTLGTIGGTAVWNATTIAVGKGGTGATTFTAGYLKANGASAFTTLAQVPNTDVSGLGTMSTQNAANVAIAGGTIGTGGVASPGITIDLGTF